MNIFSFTKKTAEVFMLKRCCLSIYCQAAISDLPNILL